MNKYCFIIFSEPWNHPVILVSFFPFNVLWSDCLTQPTGLVLYPHQWLLLHTYRCMLEDRLHRLLIGTWLPLRGLIKRLFWVLEPDFWSCEFFRNFDKIFQVGVLSLPLIVFFRSFFALYSIEGDNQMAVDMLHTTHMPWKVVTFIPNIPEILNIL